MKDGNISQTGKTYIMKIKQTINRIKSFNTNKSGNLNREKVKRLEKNYKNIS